MPKEIKIKPPRDEEPNKPPEVLVFEEMTRALSRAIDEIGQQKPPEKAPEASENS